jgi:hypothetical protein
MYYSNFEEEFRNFWTNSSYDCILAGLGLLPDAPSPRLAHMPRATETVGEVFSAIKAKQQHLLETLPSCYEFLKQQHGR